MARADEPAFPSPRERGEDHPGLTIREWFAGQALLMAGAYAAEKPGVEIYTAGQIAKHAFALADAMLAQSEKK